MHVVSEIPLASSNASRSEKFYKISNAALLSTSEGTLGGFRYDIPLSVITLIASGLYLQRKKGEVGLGPLEAEVGLHYDLLLMLRYATAE